MPLTFNTSGGSGNFKSVPAGSHIAICNLIADLGLQPGSAMYPDPKHQIYVRFEVPAERVEYERDGKKSEGPVVIGQFFTASMHEKANLRKQLESWRGKKFTDDEARNFDVSAILGKGCFLSVVENTKGDRVYSNIQSISGLPKGFTTPQAENELLYYASDDTSRFDRLPDWLQKKIREQIKPAAEAPTGVYAQPDAAGNYDFGDQPPIEAYEDEVNEVNEVNQHGVRITNDDIPF